MLTRRGLRPAGELQDLRAAVGRLQQGSVGGRALAAGGDIPHGVAAALLDLDAAAHEVPTANVRQHVRRAARGGQRRLRDGAVAAALRVERAVALHRTRAVPVAWWPHRRRSGRRRWRRWWRRWGEAAGHRGFGGGESPKGLHLPRAGPEPAPADPALGSLVGGAVAVRDEREENRPAVRRGVPFRQRDEDPAVVHGVVLVSGADAVGLVLRHVVPRRLRRPALLTGGAGGQGQEEGRHPRQRQGQGAGAPASQQAAAARQSRIRSKKVGFLVLA